MSVGWRLRLCAAVLVGLLAIELAACTTDGLPSLVKRDAATPPPTATIERPADVKYYPSEEPLRLALEHFNRGDYGLAERYFRGAVEKSPKDVTAWIGLAASYDRIGRFDLADRAYKVAVGLAGETTDILNNEGYSYMLRGDLKDARKKFKQAYARDPHNPTIINNLKLLDSSYSYIRRPSDPTGRVE